MVFDVTIGNPPYSNGADIDFIDLAYDRSLKYICLVTPAKWYTAEGNQRISSNNSYESIRTKIIGEIFKIIFYPDSRDIFNIYQIDGITVFGLRKNKDKSKHIKVINRCQHQKLYNNETYRDKLIGSLNNAGQRIIAKLEEHEAYKFNHTNGRYKVWANNQICSSGGRFMDNEGKSRVLSRIEIIDGG